MALFLRLAEPATGGRISGEFNANFSVPYLGFEGHAWLSDRVMLNGMAKYFPRTPSYQSNLTDIDMSFLFRRENAKEAMPIEWFGTLGYRFLLLHGEADNAVSEVRYSGPTLGLESHF